MYRAKKSRSVDFENKNIKCYFIEKKVQPKKHFQPREHFWKLRVS